MAQPEVIEALKRQNIHKAESAVDLQFRNISIEQIGKTLRGLQANHNLGLEVYVVRSLASRSYLESQGGRTLLVIDLSQLSVAQSIQSIVGDFAGSVSLNSAKSQLYFLLAEAFFREGFPLEALHFVTKSFGPIEGTNDSSLVKITHKPSWEIHASFIAHHEICHHLLGSDPISIPTQEYDAFIENALKYSSNEEVLRRHLEQWNKSSNMGFDYEIELKRLLAIRNMVTDGSMPRDEWYCDIWAVQNVLQQIISSPGAEKANLLDNILDAESYIVDFVGTNNEIHLLDRIVRNYSAWIQTGGKNGKDVSVAAHPERIARSLITTHVIKLAVATFIRERLLGDNDTFESLEPKLREHHDQNIQAYRTFEDLVSMPLEDIMQTFSCEKLFDSIDRLISKGMSDIEAHDLALRFFNCAPNGNACRVDHISYT